MGAISVRPFGTDDAAAVTRLLHRAYAELGRAGWNFTAVDQSVETTLDRCGRGACWLAVDGSTVVGTITISLPPGPDLARHAPTVFEPDRAWLNQVAVDPDHRGTGIASRLWGIGQRWALSNGARSFGLDTAEPAHHLIALYRGWDFAEVGHVQWPEKSYRSVLMLK